MVKPVGFSSKFTTSTVVSTVRPPAITQTVMAAVAFPSIPNRFFTLIVSMANITTANSRRLIYPVIELSIPMWGSLQ